MPDAAAAPTPPSDAGPRRHPAVRYLLWIAFGAARIILPAATVALLALAVLRCAVPSWSGVWDALSALYQGAFGSAYDLGNTLTKTIPLVLTGLGVAIAFRGRIWNIGGEGQFVVGAIAASAVGAYRLRHLPPVILIPLIMLGGALAGAAWAGVAGLMRTRRGVPEVISTIMLNFIAFQILSYFVHGPMQEADKSGPSTEYLPDAAMLPPLFGNSSLPSGLLIALVAAVIAYVFLFRTRAGYAVRVVGANPDAARAAGIDVSRTLLVAMLWSGALCGLGGAAELTGVLGRIYESYAPGYGFTAVAVALLGRLHPVGVVAAALFFGALAAGCGSMERIAGVSFTLSYVIQAVTLLVLLAFQRVKWPDPSK